VVVFSALFWYRHTMLVIPVTIPYLTNGIFAVPSQLCQPFSSLLLRLRLSTATYTVAPDTHLRPLARPPADVRLTMRYAPQAISIYSFTKTVLFSTVAQ
jgi:hypothetical protein